MFKHPDDEIVILEEGLLPRCEQCDMFVPSGAPGVRHKQTRLCSQDTDLKHKRAVTAATRDAFQQVFMVSGTPIERVATFRYLGRQTASCDADGFALYLNLKKA
jgi:hypothetical protein